METTEPQREALLSAIKYLAAGGALGAAGRAGLGLFSRPAGLDPAKPKEPLIIPVPRLVRPKEDQLQNVKLSKSWYEDLFKWQSPSGSTAQTAEDVPWREVAMGGGALAGIYGGYRLTDKLLADLRRKAADKQIEKAKQDYQNQVVGRLSKVKFACDNSSKVDDPAIKQAADAINAAFEQYDKLAVATKAAEGGEPDNIASKLLASVLTPGYMLGPQAAKVQTALMAIAGGLGGYAGYRYARDPLTGAAKADAVTKAERDAEEESPQLMVAKFVDTPAPNSTQKPVRSNSILAKMGLKPKSTFA